MASYKDVSILLIEDDPINQFMQKKALEKKNYNVIVVDTGEEALHILENQKFNIVIVDIGLPDMNGLEVIKIIRQRDEEKNKYTPIVVISAYAMQSDRENAIDAGADQFMPKPISIWELYFIVEEIIKEESAS
jgi:CheY-like chemotaxis protein